jgi:hypothetical protein
MSPGMSPGANPTATDSALQAVLDAWPRLPEHLRSAVPVLVRAAP